MKGLFGGAVIKANTLLVAQKKVLTPEGLELMANGVNLQELAKTRPELWKNEGKARRVKDKVVTTAFVTFVCAQLQTETSVFGDFKFHDSGIGVVAEAIGDVGLGTPWGGARDVGTQVASTNTYTSVATTTYNLTKAITEHGLFNASTGVTLMDRTVFAAINVVDTNQIGFTFQITFAAGG